MADETAKSKWVRSIGVGEGMHGTPEAIHRDGQVIFGWRDGPTTYVAAAPQLTVRDALAWVKKRTRDFMTNGGRESPDHKVRRKAIAAQGGAFGMKLKRELGKTEHGMMEFHTMFKPASHSAGFERADLKLAVADPKVVRVRVTRSGKVNYAKAPGMPANDGKRYKA